jgi:hypothetical protein
LEGNYDHGIEYKKKRRRKRKKNEREKGVKKGKIFTKLTTKKGSNVSKE